MLVKVKRQIDLLEIELWLIQAEAQFEPETTIGEHLLPEGLFQQ